MRLIYNFVFLSLLFSLSALQHAEATDVVGSPAGQFAVSPTGAATYSIPIDVPPGIGGMQPQISIVYNSQSGMGNVGWGCSISGLSAITRGVKDVYHDGQAKGLRYEDDDAYFLDGKRLVHVSGVEGAVGCLYHPEGEPFTEVTIKGSGIDRYFEKKTPDGLTSCYGNDSYARDTIDYNGGVVVAWYIHSVTNSLNQSVEYYYHIYDHYPCIFKISYEVGGKTCSIDFSYSILTDASTRFRVKNKAGWANKLLTSITCKEDLTTLRTYQFNYSTSYDSTEVKYPRLVSVGVIDKDQNSLSPLSFNWIGNPPSNLTKEIPSPMLYESNSYETVQSKTFLSTDINGDGLCDLIEIHPMQSTIEGNVIGVSAFFSELQNNGQVSMSSRVTARESGFPVFDGRFGYNMLLDYDGNGTYDVIIPFIYNIDGLVDRYYCSWIGYDKNNGTFSENYDGYHNLKVAVNSDNLPLSTGINLNGTARSSILVLESKPYNGKYYGFAKQYNAADEEFSLTLSATPKKLFKGDFDNDGLDDIIVIKDDGYSIFFNQRGQIPSGTVFSDSHRCDGTTIGDAYVICPGDFNGDGLVDFVTKGLISNYWYFVLNNGDGTFSKNYAGYTSLYDRVEDEERGQYCCLPIDFDHDGRTDIVYTKSLYSNNGSYLGTHSVWLRSTGNMLSQKREAIWSNREDSRPVNFTVGDFNGDGYEEILNYGNDCYNGNASTSTQTVNIYFNKRLNCETGKIKTISDGFGNTTEVSYANMSDQSVYTLGTGASYPVVDICSPFHVVREVKIPTVATATPLFAMTETYTYEGLKAHVAGRGLLGFTKTIVDNDVTGTTTTNETGGWSAENHFTPTMQKTTVSLGAKASESTSSFDFVDKDGGKNFFRYATETVNRDYDGYTVNTTYGYDTNLGKIHWEKTVYDRGDYSNYKQVVYYYLPTKICGQWLPDSIDWMQKHPDDALAFSNTRKFSYNNKALPTMVIDHASTELADTISYLYNSIGNVIGKTERGKNLSTVTKYFDYESTGRFVSRTYTSPASTVTTYTYDAWGNVLTETDATVASSPLTTTNTYDGFGNLLTSTSPEGIVTTTSRTWGTSPTGKYCVSTTTPGQPYTLTWYDSRGRKVSEETAGAGGTANLTQYRYDERGNLSFSSRAVVDGPPQLTQAEAGLGGTASPDVAPPSDPPSLDAVYLTTTMAYDGRGRLTSETYSTGKSTTYSYTGRKVTATTNGRVYEKTYDAWGLLKQSKEPVGTVSYLYHSCGKPRSASTGSSTVTMAYDNCGNQVSLTDPDAGTTSYTYNAAGEVVSQTDARGITTTHTRDALNRITKTTTGTTEVSYAYGTSGNAAQRLTQLSSGNYAISYAYNQYGRVTAETRNFGSTQYATAYTYDADGHLATATYPGSVQVTYGYDSYGFENSMSVNGSSVWTLTSHSPQATVEQLGTGSAALRRSTARNQYGLLTGITLQKVSNSSTLHQMTFTHDAVTGNLTRRTGMVPSITGESFSYDALDRLVYYYDHRAQHEAVCQYDNTGNIEFKTYYGYYNYRPTTGMQPHGVKQVDNSSGYIPLDDQNVSYNDLGKASEIYTAHGSSGHLYLDYGPDGQRWKTQLYKSSTAWPDTVRYYVGDMEGVETGPSGITWTYHLGHGVILRKYGLSAGTQPTVYYTFTDNLGSVTRIYNTSGTAVFSAYYDPWGVQTVTTNTIGYSRGYCGHEMLNDFQLINMNGRLYDPYIARFLSTDNYVQLPTSAQSFNRYSYCLNNPLKYVDPDGEWFGLDDLLIAMTGFTSGYFSNVLITGKWGGSSLKAGLVSAGMAWLGYNTAGLSTGSVTSQTINYVLSTCTNTAVNTLCPPITIPINSHFSLSFSPAFGFGEGGLSAGLNIGAEYSNGDFSTSITIGAGSGYKGWFAQANYNDWTVGYGITYYDATTYNGHQLGKQAVGTGKLSYKDYSFTLSNDLFADGRDRWRTSAAELSIGDFSVGTYVVTNWGAQESLYEHKDAKAPLLGEGPLKAWKNGEVLSAPFWVGLRHNAQTYRVGYSSKYVQSLTQNAVHKYITPTPFFIDYDKMKVGMFSYFGYNNPLTLWNF